MTAAEMIAEVDIQTITLLADTELSEETHEAIWRTARRVANDVLRETLDPAQAVTRAEQAAINCITLAERAAREDA